MRTINRVRSFLNRFHRSNPASRPVRLDHAPRVVARHRLHGWATALWPALARTVHQLRTLDGTTWIQTAPVDGPADVSRRSFAEADADCSAMIRRLRPEPSRGGLFVNCRELTPYYKII